MKAPIPETDPARRRRDRFAAAGTLAFALLVTFGLVQHEMWRDELQAWLLVRDSASLGEMLHSLRYEGHPAAWYLLLYPLARMNGDPATMQVLHLVLAVTTAWLVLRFAPLPRWQRALVVASYFLAYEYAVISRSYVLAALALFAACAALPLRRRTYLSLAGLLALLANTSAYGILVAGAFATAVGAEAWLEHRSASPPGSRGRHLGISAALLALAAAAAVLQVLPPSDARFVGAAAAEGPVSREWGIASSIAVIWNGYVPIPASNVYPWDERILLAGSTAGLVAAAALSVGLFVAFAGSVARRPAALAFYVMGTAALVAFAWRVHLGATRHHGHLFLVLVGALWLARTTPEWRLAAALARPVGWAEKARPFLFGAVLAAQLIAAGWLYMEDARRPFSTARDLAEAARALDLDRYVLVTDSRSTNTAVSAFLDRPVYVPEVQRWETFVDRRRRPDAIAFEAEGLERARALMGPGRNAVLVVSNRRSYPGVPGWELERLGILDDALTRSERFTLWRARPVQR